MGTLTNAIMHTAPLTWLFLWYHRPEGRASRAPTYPIISCLINIVGPVHAMMVCVGNGGTAPLIIIADMN